MALSSMTGYGRATRGTPRLTATVEVRSVNGRHLGVRCRVPSEWMRLEPRIEAAVRATLARGAVDVFVRLDRRDLDEIAHVEATIFALDLGRPAKRGGIDL